MPTTTSFHGKLAQHLVNLELKKLHDRNPSLGHDANGDPVKWNMLFEPFSSYNPPTFFPPPLRSTASYTRLDHPVAIIGGGMAGLRVAMMLEAVGVPYRLFEASNRIGGRAFTYRFKKGEGEGSVVQDYFDVGPMRFPKNAVNASTYDLFKELDFTDEGGKGGKLVRYDLESSGNVLLSIRHSKDCGRSERGPQSRQFQRWCKQGRNGNKIFIPAVTPAQPYAVYGVDACLEAAYRPFRQALAKDWEEGWSLLMKQDHHSTTSYMLDVMKYPWSVVQWMERSDSGTAGFDLMGFTESIMDSLEFDYPTGDINDPGPKSIEWRCIEGGAETLAKAMYNSLQHKDNIRTGMLVTSIGKVTSDETTLMEITVQDTPAPFMREKFSHVISTVPFACLRAIDLSQCGLDYEQDLALRSLTYGPAVKVGIKFKTRWWQDQEPSGGSSKTDRQSRVVIYPSYGLGDPKGAPGVLMATYNW